MIRETEIIQGLERGDQQALITLFDSCYRPLCIYALRYLPHFDDAEDVVQEVFVSFWKNKNGKRFQGSLRAYLFGAVAKSAIKQASRNKRTSLLETSHFQQTGTDIWAVPDEQEMIRVAERIDAEVANLPDRSREAFQLVVLENLSYPQVAVRMGVTKNTVKTLYYRAIKQLREQLDEHSLLLLLYFF